MALEAARVLIVDALARGSYGKRMVTVDAVGAGPRTVAGVLEMLGVHVDLAVPEVVFEEPNILRDYNVLMVSAMSIDAPTVRRLVRLWRRRARGPVLLGGPIALEEGSLTATGSDLAVVGEAEPVIEKLFSEELVTPRGLDYQRLHSMCGVRFYEPGAGVVSRPRCPLMTRRMWERYRPSTRVVKGYPLYWASRIYVEVVRGCSNYTIPSLDTVPPELRPDKPRPGCAYCSVVTLWGYARSRSPDLVYQEVKALIDEGVTRIVLSGPDILDYGRDWLVEPRPLVDPRSPPPNVDALESLLSRLTSIPEVAAGEAGIMAENAKPNLVTEEAAETLGRYLRGTPIHVGVETGDPRLLESFGRPATLRETLQGVERLVRHGLRVYAYIMYCLPGETALSIEKTVKLIDKLYKMGVEKITAYKFMPLPGSALEKLATRPPRRCEDHPVKLAAAEANRKAKRRLIGQRMNAIVAGVHPRYRRPLAYPIPHGPVLLLEDRGLELGEIVEARVTGVRGDRMVEAVVVKKLARAKAVKAAPGPGGRLPAGRRARRPARG